MNTKNLFSLSAFGLFLFLAAGSSEDEMTPEQKKQKADSELNEACDKGANAASYSRQLIRNAIVGEITFLRETESVRKVSQCKFRIFGAVEGTNAFGAKVRNYYTIQMEARFRDDSKLDWSWYGTQPFIDSDHSIVRRVYSSD